MSPTTYNLQMDAKERIVMEEINSLFKKARIENRKIFIPYFPAGYPNIAKSRRAFLQLAKSGADLIEVGIPFSDPIADGPTIQAASTTALQAGLQISQVFEMLNSIREKMPPVAIMTYYNLLYANGLKNFARKAARAGVKALIIPDLPIEEADDWLRASSEHLETIFFLAPTSSDERINKTARATTAFIYCVSLTGVTGARKELPIELSVFLKRVRRQTDKYLSLGFGISNKEQIKGINKLVDGIIVGSAIIKTYDKGKNEQEALSNLDVMTKKFN